MADLGGLNIGDMLKKVMDNPEMLKGAIDLASKLKDTNMLGSLLGGIGDDKDTPKDPPEHERYDREDREDREDRFDRPDRADRSEKSEDTHPLHVKSNEDRRRLLLALRPFMSETRRDKIDFILSVLQLLELAEKLGITSII